MKNLFLLTIAMILLGLGPTNAATADDGLAARMACEALILDYSWHWDHNNHEDFANLFTDDADFQAAGRVDKGRDEILAEQMKRTGKVVTRSFFTNIRVTSVDDKTSAATSYFMVHSEAAGESAGSIPTRGFRLIGEMAFSCSLTDDGWRISSVDLTPIFADENLED